MEIIDKVQIVSTLSDFKVWQYARVIDIVSKDLSDEQSGVNAMCEVLELSSDKQAHIWREQYKSDFTIACFERVKKVLEQTLQSDQIKEFTFSTLTPEDRSAREQQIVEAIFFNRKSLRANLAIDLNRTYYVEKIGSQTLEQVINAEMIMKELISIDAELTAKQYSRLPRLLAFICKLKGERLHYFDKNDNQYKFNYALIDYREKVFMHLDIVTAWGVYLAFFLTERQSSSSTIISGIN